MEEQLARWDKLLRDVTGPADTLGDPNKGHIYFLDPSILCMYVTGQPAQTTFLWAPTMEDERVPLMVFDTPGVETMRVPPGVVTVRTGPQSKKVNAWGLVR